MSLFASYNFDISALSNQVYCILELAALLNNTNLYFIN